MGRLTGRPSRASGAADGAWRDGDAGPIRRAHNEEVTAEPTGLTDSLGLRSPTGARSVRLDTGFAPTATGTDGQPGRSFPETLLAADWVHAQLPSLRLTLEEVT